MQRVVRNTLVGLLTIAGLTACGDKVTVPPPTTTPAGTVVHQVTVSPAQVSLNVGDKTTLAASVNADAGVTNRTVTWSSGNTAIATVDANGVVTAVAAGNTSIIAKSAADPSVQGAAAVTVGGGAPGGTAVITISTVNTTNCAVGGICSSTPANLNNVTGQLDVTVNVDPGSQRLVGVDLLLNCGAGDIVVQSQTIASAAQASAEASAAPVTLSFNTADFTDSTGAVKYKNGACTIKARARTNATAGGAITTTTSTAQNIVLNNQDVVYATITSTKSAINPVTNLVWNGGDVTVRAVPLLYSGRTAGTMTVTFECRTVTRSGAGPQSFTFIDANDAQANPCTGTGTPLNTGAGVALTGPTLQSITPGATPASNNIDNITDPAATATFTLVDNAGQPVLNPVSCGAVNALCSQASVLVNVNAPVAMASIRLDTQRPAAGTLNLASNALQGTTAGGYIGGGFRFAADSAAGYVGPNAGSLIGTGACAGNNGAVNPVVCNQDNGGVDSVTVVFLSATSRTGTRTAVTSTSGLAESATNATYNLIQVTTDRLGNADTSFVVSNGTAQVPFASITGTAATSRFGVDRTGPALQITASPTANQASMVIHPVGSKDYSVSVRDTATGTAAPSGPAPQVLLAQVKQNSTNGTGTLPASGKVYTNGNENADPNTGCVVGVWNRGTTGGSATALPVYDATGAQIGTCSPTLYTLVVGTTVSANIAGGSEYATTRIIGIDQAGNQSAPFTNAVLEDAVAPGVPVIDAPTSISGGSSVTFAARATDNLDVVGGSVQISYPGQGMLLQYPVAAGPGVAFDNVLTTTGTISPVVNFFFRNLHTSTVGQPIGQGQNATLPTQLNVNAVDAAGWSAQTGLQNLSLFTTFSQPDTTKQIAGNTSNVYSSNFNGGFSITGATNTTLSDCPTAGCAGSAPASSPTSTTLTATAAGISGVLANPFATVQFWYQVNGTGPWFYAGTAANSGVRDTGVSGQRFFDYTLTFTPPKQTDIDPATGAAVSLTGGATLTFKAIGANSTGDGLMSLNTQAITLVNP